MIYFQYGARGVNLLEKFINDDLINGIIWDPRFSHKDLIEQRKKYLLKKCHVYLILNSFTMSMKLQY